MMEIAADLIIPGDLNKDAPVPPVKAPQFQAKGIGFLRRVYGRYKLITAPLEAARLLSALPDSALGLLAARPGGASALASRPFVCSRWSSRLRLRRMIEHCAVIDTVGHPFTVTGKQYVEIIAFNLDGARCRLMLDQPRWLYSDGLLCVSLWAGPLRVFTVSFCLSDSAGVRTAYVGGIQGHRSDDALDQNRALTKAAHGMRPRDLVFDLFRMLLPGLGVTQVKCVTDSCRYQMTRRASISIAPNDKVQLDYDETWGSRGGVPGTDGFFVVPLIAIQRDASEIPTKKRSMYRKRYALLDELQDQINLALQAPLTTHFHRDFFTVAA